jgi:glutamyl-tRNA synthetase
MNNDIRVRFAPSPTGYLHIGGVRTALFNYLFAKHHGGTFILRIEDTDRSRFVPEALEEIESSLRWLGLDWDEGPGRGGEFGPYTQSERASLYKSFAGQLLAKDAAYRCFCTPERLAQVREAREKQKQPTSYDRFCRDMKPEKTRQLLDAGMPHVVRLKTPLHQDIVFHDAIRGAIEYKSEVLDDLVLLKSDGLPTYHLASVVDDHAMRITHVLRGEEWIASTPRHLLIYQAFEWKPPAFAHLPVILAPDGGKLSKRKGAVSVMDYKKAGYLPKALVNFLAFLGWSPGDDREKMTCDELIASFSLERVTPKAAVLDEKKLEWMNGVYMQEANVDSIIDDVIARWKALGFVSADADTNDSYLRSVVGLLKDRSKKLEELAHNAEYFFKDPDQYEAKAVKKHFKGGALDVLKQLTARFEKCESFDEKSLEDLYRDHVEENQISAGKLIHPTRLAVSGVSFGPGLFEMLALIGKERVISRMKKAIAWLEQRGAADSAAPAQQ